MNTKAKYGCLILCAVPLALWKLAELAVGLWHKCF